ncbi:MAG: CysZ protein [Arenicella sp.]
MFFKDFKLAISHYGEGFRLLSKLRLWKFILVPALIAILVAAGIIWASFALAPSVGNYISDFWPFSFWENTIQSISNFLGSALIIILGVIVFRHMVMAFSGPFMAPISRKIEDHLRGKKTISEIGFMTSLLRSIRINVRNLLLETLLTLPFLLLGLIPIFNILTIILLFFFSAYFAGFGNLDYTLERHFKYRDSVKWVQNHRGLATGNGTIFMFILLIPVVGILLVLPLSCSAATVSVVKKF